MAAIFDLYRSGYLTGQQHGQLAERRRAAWELQLTHFRLWLPGVDNESFLRGYQAGYEDAMRLRSALIQLQH